MPNPASTPTLDRRTFMRRGAMGAGALWTVSLTELLARRRIERTLGPSPYGSISPRIDQNTGWPLLQLPEGFTYLSAGWTGDRMSDGIRTPSAHDGMAVVGNYRGNPNLLTLVRNHELSSAITFGTPDLPRYSSNSGGGTTNMIFDARRGRFVKTFASLAGTRTNCAGGVTPWGTWITCEEDTSSSSRPHGWCFDVGPDGGDPTPLTAMGRFRHEAIMVDASPDSGGTVYLTEDNGGTSGFYRFVPSVYGDLRQGELSMLKVTGVTQADLRFVSAVGTVWGVEWVTIGNPETNPFAQGRTAGAAQFNRLEGAWWGSNSGYFLSTNGGSVGEGQVFEYNPHARTLTLIYNSSNFNDCDNPDNLVVTPQGQLLLCEDAAGAQGDVLGERLVGLTLDGQTFPFAQNNMDLTDLPRYNDLVAPTDHSTNEWAGACFSPDGKWLFVNIQTPGVTFAITGPWHEGPL